MIGRKAGRGNPWTTSGRLKGYRETRGLPSSLLAQFGARAGKVARGLGIVGSQLHRLLKLPARLVEPGGLREGQAEGVMQFGVGGRELHRLLEMRSRLPGPPRLTEREPEMMMSPGEQRIETQGSFEFMD